MTARTCDGCRACCTVLGIRDLDKPNHVACQHERLSGCAIYDDGRPQVCIDFKCGWLESNEDFRHMERPDEVGLIFARANANEPLSKAIQFAPILAHECHPGAALSTAAQKTLARLARTVLVCVRAAGDARERTDHPVYGPEPARSRAIRLMKRNAIFGGK